MLDSLRTSKIWNGVWVAIPHRWFTNVPCRLAGEVASIDMFVNISNTPNGFSRWFVWNLSQHIPSHFGGSSEIQGAKSMEEPVWKHQMTDWKSNTAISPIVQDLWITNEYKLYTSYTFLVCGVKCCLQMPWEFYSSHVGLDIHIIHKPARRAVPTFHLAWDKAIFVYKLAVTGWEVHSLALVFCDFHPQN